MIDSSSSPEMMAIRLCDCIGIKTASKTGTTLLTAITLLPAIATSKIQRHATMYGGCCTVVLWADTADKLCKGQ